MNCVKMSLHREPADCRLYVRPHSAWLLRGRKLNKPTVKKTFVNELGLIEDFMITELERPMAKILGETPGRAVL